MDLLYLEYKIISDRFKGWTLSEIKAMPRYERVHWINVCIDH
jgi:hypothetical protein